MRKLIVAFFIIFCIGCTIMIYGTLYSGESLPVRVSFNTYSKYTNELNSFFNRTEVTPSEDAQNKLIEDYRVAGYIITPKTGKPPEGYPVIIWMHGFGVSADIQMNFPLQFTKAGFFTIALDQPGHGWSGGHWDMGIETLLGVYSTIEWLVNDSNYQDLIDAKRIGVSGHSMGGVATTRAGIFDNWINPKTGNRIGTGRIRSNCAVFCWDDVQTMAENLMESRLGIKEIWSHKTILDIMVYWRWFSNHDPSGLKEEISIRSVSNFISSSNITNYCLIIGGDDGLVSVESQSFIVANATTNSTGIPQVSWDVINDTVHNTINHTWNFGNFSVGEARRLVLVPGIEHFEEGLNREVLENIILWFSDSMNCTEVNSDVPNDFQVGYLLKMLGWIITLAVSLGAIIPSFFILSESRIAIKSEPAKIAPNIQDKEKKIYYIIYILISVLLIGMSGLIKVNSITHFWMFDLFIIPRLLIGALFLIIPMILLVILESIQNSYHPSDIGLNSSLVENFKNVFIPLITIGFWLTLFNITAWIIQVPLLLPRPFNIEVFLDFIILLGILLIFNFLIEFLFRGLYQTKLLNKNGSNVTAFEIICKSGLMSGICLGLGFTTSVLLPIFDLFLLKPILILVLYGSFTLIFLLLGVISAVVYHKTGNIISSTVLNSLLLALFISGKIILVYA
ncbi:MAG: alpha/beta hydrolase family protein [Candidatus Hodarchaeota archaeon]